MLPVIMGTVAFPLLLFFLPITLPLYAIFMLFIIVLVYCLIARCQKQELSDFYRLRANDLRKILAPINERLKERGVEYLVGKGGAFLHLDLELNG